MPVGVVAESGEGAGAAGCRVRVDGDVEFVAEDLEVGRDWRMFRGGGCGLRRCPVYDPARGARLLEVPAEPGRRHAQLKGHQLVAPILLKDHVSVSTHTAGAK